MQDNPPLTPDVTDLKRTAFLPETTEGDGGVTDSKFSGRPWLAADEEWPTCPNCSNPLQLFLQLNLADLPAVEQERLGDRGLLQLFYCTNSDPLCEVDCEAFFPFADSEVARFVEDPGADCNASADGPADPLAPRSIVGWEAVDDLPNTEELKWDMDIEVTDQERDYLYDCGMPHPGDKLAGWPYWIQGVEYPDCPECDSRMELVFQIDSNCNLDYMFGDIGAGHLTRCPNHPGVLAFGWACG